MKECYISYMDMKDLKFKIIKNNVVVSFLNRKCFKKIKNFPGTILSQLKRDETVNFP